MITSSLGSCFCLHGIPWGAKILWAVISSFFVTLLNPNLLSGGVVMYSVWLSMNWIYSAGVLFQGQIVWGEVKLFYMKVFAWFWKRLIWAHHTVYFWISIVSITTWIFAVVMLEVLRSISFYKRKKVKIPSSMKIRCLLLFFFPFTIIFNTISPPYWTCNYNMQTHTIEYEGWLSLFGIWPLLQRNNSLLKGFVQVVHF